jgi:hypothetical protein
MIGEEERRRLGIERRRGASVGEGDLRVPVFLRDASCRGNPGAEAAQRQGVALAETDEGELLSVGRQEGDRLFRTPGEAGVRDVFFRERGDVVAILGKEDEEVVELRGIYVREDFDFLARRILTARARPGQSSNDSGQGPSISREGGRSLVKRTRNSRYS